MRAESTSEFLAALLVYDCSVSLASCEGTSELALGDLMRDTRALAGRIITAVSIETAGIARAARAARSSADRPIVAAVARKTATGERRLALTGVAATPLLVEDVETLDPTSDFLGSSVYRRALAGTLAARVLAAID